MNKKINESINLMKIEMEKCKSSPYYFFINYYTINGKPAKTNLTEKEFNDWCLKLPKHN